MAITSNTLTDAEVERALLVTFLKKHGAGVTVTREFLRRMLSENILDVRYDEQSDTFMAALAKNV